MMNDALLSHSDVVLCRCEGSFLIEHPQHHGCYDDGDAVAGGDACPHAHCSIVVGQDEQQRYEEQHLAAHGEEDALLGHTDALEEVAYDYLESYQRTHQHDDFHAFDGQLLGLCIVGEDEHAEVREELA